MSARIGRRLFLGIAASAAGATASGLWLPATAAAGESSLAPGQLMRAGEQIVSSDGRYRAVMQHDGNFVIYGPDGRPTWASNTAGIGDGGFVVMQGDGNLVIYSSNDVPRWASSTAGSANSAVTMQTDGNLVVYSAGGLPLWSAYGGRTKNSLDVLGSGGVLQAGQFIKSRNGSFTAVMQHDGNFVEYGPSGPTWSSATAGNGDGCRVAMQGDGNLVVYTAAGRAVFSSSTAPASGCSLAVQDDGNLVIYDGAGRPLWAKGTRASAAGGAPTQWAKAHLGQVYGTSSEQPYAAHQWSGYCLTFVQRAFGNRVVTGQGTAQRAWDYYSSRGQTRNGVPPADSAVFWSYGSAGHVAVGIGDGQTIGTVGKESQRKAVAQYAYNNRGLSYLGYVIP